MPLRVVGGDLQDVLGPGRRSGEWSFVPADIQLEGSSWSPEADLGDQPGTANSSDDLRDLVRQRLDAVWARARIKAVFDVDSPPEDDRPEKTLMQFGFAATQGQNPEVTYVFECTDYYGKAQLCFGETQPDEETRAAVAAAFWTLLLAEPDVLADYEDRAYHSGAGVWMHYGRRNGELFYEELQDT
jgi:hypothetical protein